MRTSGEASSAWRRTCGSALDAICSDHRRSPRPHAACPVAAASRMSLTVESTDAPGSWRTIIRPNSRRILWRITVSESIESVTEECCARVCAAAFFAAAFFAAVAARDGLRVSSVAPAPPSAAPSALACRKCASAVSAKPRTLSDLGSHCGRRRPPPRCATSVGRQSSTTALRARRRGGTAVDAASARSTRSALASPQFGTACPCESPAVRAAPSPSPPSP